MRNPITIGKVQAIAYVKRNLEYSICFAMCPSMQSSFPCKPISAFSAYQYERLCCMIERPGA